MSRNKLLILALALLTIVAQLFVPISMAKRYEDVLQTGESYLFKVQPRDPADPFKGRYVVLTFPISRGETTDLESPEVISKLNRKATAYALIENGPDGFVRIKDIRKETPTTQSFIEVKNNYSYNEKYHIKLPFDRYYAEESKAPEIESLLWNRARDENREFYADVRIKNGFGVIRELYVEGTPILEYLSRDQDGDR